MFSLPLWKANLDAASHCIARSTDTIKRGTFTTQVKNVTFGSNSRGRVFISNEKQKNHANKCGDSTQAHVFVIYW